MGKHEKKVHCSTCNGKGKIEEWADGKSRKVKCQLCDGTGKVP
jgi:DnaJ-class molecular chaperone